jgi:peptide/nickel transport system ATP-binding protein
MYLGHAVEMGSTDQVFQSPYPPYPEALLSAVPVAEAKVIRKWWGPM